MFIALDSNKVREAVKAGANIDAILRDFDDRGVSFDSQIGKMGILARPAAEMVGRGITFSDDGRGHHVVACDAQPDLVTAPNGGIPAYLTNYFDPEQVRIALS